MTCAYTSPVAHTLYLGTRYLDNGARGFHCRGRSARGGTPLNLELAGEDVLVRYPVGTYAAGSHTVTVAHAGSAGELFYFDFVEAAVPTTTLPTFPNEPRMTLATDWDTEHSLALAPERTAWLMDTLGFTARAESLCGRAVVLRAGEFGERVRDGDGDVHGRAGHEFGGDQFGNDRRWRASALTKLVHMGDTADTLALAYADELNNGYTGFWASASGNVLTITARMLGSAGECDHADDGVIATPR